MEPFQFETDHFKITNSELHLLRSGYTYKKIGFKEITRISIGKGVVTKRPLGLLLFGLIVIGASVYFFLVSSGFIEIIINNDIEPGFSVKAFRGFGYLIIMIGFLLALGGVAIYQATFPTWIMRTEFKNGTFEIFSLKKLFIKNEVFELTRFLRKNLSSSKLKIDNRIG